MVGEASAIPAGIFPTDRYHFLCWVCSPPADFRAMRALSFDYGTLLAIARQVFRPCSINRFHGCKLSDRCLLVCHDTVVATVKFGLVAALWERVTWPSRPKNANNRWAATVLVPRHYPRSGSDEGPFGSRNPHANVGGCQAGCFAKKSRSLSDTTYRR